jgi:hypothetical protein
VQTACKEGKKCHKKEEMACTASMSIMSRITRKVERGKMLGKMQIITVVQVK